MRIHLRADEANGTHTRFTVFVNGANCGELCMREEEAIFFHEVVLRSTYKLPSLMVGDQGFLDQYDSSGHWFKEREKVNNGNI